MEQNKKNWHDKYYKLLLIIPAIMILFSVIYLFQFNAENGDIIGKDVSITGGTVITVFDANIAPSDVVTALSAQFPDINSRAISDFRTGTQEAFYIETSSPPEDIQPALEQFLGYELNQDNSSIEFTGSSISSSFYQQLRLAVIIAFVFMAIVVFIIFRTPIPSLAVILAAFADILFTIVTINLLGINLSIGGIVALLMLIGYSVDTDILLTTRILRKKGESLNKRMAGAFTTGITMALTSGAAVGVALILTYNLSETLRQIFTILLIGLGFDIFNTWITNASLLKWYAEAKKIQ